MVPPPDPILQRLHRVIRKLAASDANFHYSHHAREEMQKDHLTDQDVLRVLTTGLLVELGQSGRAGEPRFVMQGRTLDGVLVRVVVELPEEETPTIVIVTVFACRSKTTMTHCEECGVDIRAQRNA